MHKGTPISMVWDASKAYMRGVLIYLNKNHMRKQMQTREELENELKLKEKAFILNPSDNKLRTSINILKEQFDMLIADQIATNLRYAKYNTFCNANKPGRWLAYQLRKKQRARIIEKIEYKGKEVYRPELIKKAFLEFYTQLYAEGNIRATNIETYLQAAHFPKLTEDQKKEMDNEITTEEIVAVIKQLKLGKAPGTDGLTAIYYTSLSEEMMEPLKELFNDILNGREVPPSWKTAFISLIPKEGQNLAQPKNYRPISLLNIDYKIFAKVWANRLMQVLKQLIHTDQAGFIIGRYMKNNVRQILNLIEYLDKNNQIPAALIFIDAEKAFDQLNWQFLIKLVDKMNFGNRFLSSLKAIYQQQKAQIVINGGLTDSFEIGKGTRQGCPLSPLLFILTLEILLIKIRESPIIKGIKIKQNDYKLRAFADDLVVSLSNPIQSIEELMEIVVQYGKVSGFKVNKNKTKILVKNMPMRQKEVLMKQTGFEIAREVKYLGVYMTASNVKLYKNNYLRLWNKVQIDLNNWKKLQLSLLGRIAAVKMNVLPKFLFLFQMIPILKNDSNLEEWQKGINKFIWGGKKPRVKLKIVQDVRERGGLKVPNLKIYYDAAALTFITDWLNLSNKDILQLEGWDLWYGWHAYLIYNKKIDSAFRSHILRSALLRVWRKYNYKLNKIPIWTIPSHAVEGITKGVNLEGISYKEILRLEGNDWKLRSREELQGENWFQYNQLVTRWNLDKMVGITLTDDNLIKQIKDSNIMHIKRIYNVLLELDSAPELVKDCMIKWAQNIQEPIPLDTWEVIWVRNVKFTQAQNLRENFYKMFYRWHLDPQKLSRMYPNVQSKCWRCGSLDATYFHIWWTCRNVKAFWIKIWWNIQLIFKRKIKFNPQLFLLGIVTDCDVKETNLMLYLITAARLLVGQYWKKDSLPTIEEWTLKVSYLAQMAKISAYVKDHSQERYISIWRKWLEYIQKKYGTTKFHLAYE